MRRFKIASLAVAAATAGVVLTAAPAQAHGNEGCTPGYWKNHTESWEVYSPSRQMGTVWDFPSSLSEYGALTFEEGLRLKGGPGVEGATQILLRASVASYLNAAHSGLDYPLRRFQGPVPGPLRTLIEEALASGDRQQMLDVARTLDEANNLGCPLN